MIATFSVGYDHIDLNECERRNIRVCNCPYENLGQNLKFLKLMQVEIEIKF